MYKIDAQITIIDTLKVGLQRDWPTRAHFMISPSAGSSASKIDVRCIISHCVMVTLQVDWSFGFFGAFQEIGRQNHETAEKDMVFG